MLYASVAVPVPLGQAFTYAVRQDLQATVRPGVRVLCELGRRRVLGVVLEVTDRVPELAPEKLKEIKAVVDDEPIFPEELLRFLITLGRYYLAPIGEVVRLALPAVERSAAERLERQGWVVPREIKAVGRLLQVAEYVEGAVVEGDLAGPARQIVELLQTEKVMPLADLAKQHKNARAVVKRLQALGLVRITGVARAADRFFSESIERTRPPELTPPQRQAVTAITRALTQGRIENFLLDGVTASGKTEVYLHAVQHCLGQGRSAMVLVPEIALTPQLVGRFRARLGDEIAVLHSALSHSARHAMWRRLRQGELKVVIGARSALFAPIPRLGLICIDEEHDASFKQEEGVRYHARDMALLRAQQAQGVCVLGSATPSIASEALVLRGRLSRLVLPARAHASAKLPVVEIIDLRRMGPGPTGERLLTVPLHRALEAVLGAREQAILFLNRRGFAPSVVCESCGTVAECKHCSVALTLHRTPAPRLICHYCDAACDVPETCEKCGSAQLGHEGTGTERVEAALHQAFPEARIARLDRDVAAGLKSEKVLDRMRAREIDFLVGTQMVTKGHDLPGVTLVGVLNADAALSLPDFQASERTFQLLVQVAGRAGRAEAPGKVLIQTRNPEHPAIACAATHDVRSFVGYELTQRQELRYPPFSRLALVRLDATLEHVVRGEAERLAQVARRAAPSPLVILGPAPAPLGRLRNRYRYRFLLRGAERSDLRPALLAVLQAQIDRRVRVTVDVDPVSML